MRKDKIPSEKSITTGPFPKSKKVYVSGKLHDIKVAMREVALHDTISKFDKVKPVEKNPAVTLYDTSGPYTDENHTVDVKKGLPKLRQQWILDRGDVEELDEISSEYGRQQLLNSELDHLRFEHLKKPL
ncbi:MAG: phosphomethylpyrimidine synthase ThiC, partial [Cyclobacteriaceae bacterium]